MRLFLAVSLALGVFAVPVGWRTYQARQEKKRVEQARADRQAKYRRAVKPLPTPQQTGKTNASPQKALSKARAELLRKLSLLQGMRAKADDDSPEWDLLFRIQELDEPAL